MNPKNHEKGAPAAATVLFIIFRSFKNDFDFRSHFELKYLHFGTQKSILRRLGASLGRLGPSWGRLGDVLGASWKRLGPFWERLGRILAHLGTSWRVLGRHGTVLAPF